MAARTLTERNALHTTWDLERDATLRVPRLGTGTVVEVVRGTVLVTREGDLEDHVLEPGMTLPLGAQGRVVAWALVPSTVRVRATQGFRWSSRERREPAAA